MTVISTTAGPEDGDALVEFEATQVSSWINQLSSTASFIRFIY